MVVDAKELGIAALCIMLQDVQRAFLLFCFLSYERDFPLVAS
jgi:hypothetical protein